MKLMTLNTHSLEEKDYEAKLHACAVGICREMPDVIALQEVNQTQTAAPADRRKLAECGYVSCDETAAVRNDNHAFRLARILAGRGTPYQWTWNAAKTGYGRYDEGLAVLSRLPIAGTRQFYITAVRDYSNWKTRKILGICISTELGIEYFYSVHMGWWDDNEEPFREQWKRICQGLASESTAAGDTLAHGGALASGGAPASGARVWLMGDFNSPAQIQGEGKDLIRNSGWLDSYELAVSKDSGITVSHAIDGWRERGELPGMRIDYIWTNRPVRVRSSRTIFDGTCSPVVSDHFGIIMEYESGHCPLKGAHIE